MRKSCRPVQPPPLQPQWRRPRLRPKRRHRLPVRAIDLCCGLGFKATITLIFCGVRPICPITGMPRCVKCCTVSAMRARLQSSPLGSRSLSSCERHCETRGRAFFISAEQHINHHQSTKNRAQRPPHGQSSCPASRPACFPCHTSPYPNCADQQQIDMLVDQRSHCAWWEVRQTIGCSPLRAMSCGTVTRGVDF